ncbi:aldo/keto reductase [Streptomyces davaonensis JCM 4913]|uniref:Aldo/keto reductase n=1 Tax=Streptomyces davaonensis (strain DSM 101723 / JCM 4913 / KCC S-0913 / 768) TaxID=1214101 RepID=K4R206_STRDJ|nr:aldo/keto reductase [Streptomyces davaonensis]CCK27348.1 aldo/keto reductase [Streptomyces davaonensis JCM 4913]
MRYRTLGDVRVSAIGLGAMPLSIEGRPDERRALATVHAALDAGVTLLDTADSYHLPGEAPGHNELLVARALATYGGRPDDVLVATKGGRGRPADGSWTVNGDPDWLRSAAEASLKRLGVESIGLYQLHKPDPSVPFEESVGALRELAEEGKVRLVGISNTDVDQIRAAHGILGDRLVSVQNRYSPAVRDSEAELRLCAELGLAFLPWSPLGGISRSSLDGPSRLAGGAAGPLEAFHAVARERGVSAQQVCLAWLLSLSPTVVPIPGASRPETIRDSAGAADLVLSAPERARLDEAVRNR